MEENNNNLIISYEEFEFGYNYDFVKYLKQDYNGSDYISWSVAFRILKELFPAFIVEMASNYECKAEQAEGVTTMVLLRIRDLATDKVTPVLHYPVIGNRNEGIINPTCRQVSDSLQRAYVKCIAINTGIGYRIFTREEVDFDHRDKNSKTDHPKFKGLQFMSELTTKVMTDVGAMPEDWETPHFGMSVPVLRDKCKQLQVYLREFKAPPTLAVVSSKPTSYYEYKTFKMPSNWESYKDSIAWAMEFAGLNEEQAAEAFEKFPNISFEEAAVSYFHYIIDEYVPEDSVV